MCSSRSGKQNRIKGLALKLMCIGLIATPCFAEDILNPTDDPYFNMVFGISPFLGVLGAEYQRQHHAFGIGYPNRLSYRYYVKPYQDSRFGGVYLGTMTYQDQNETVDGVLYEDLKTKYIGVGIGYRWQWPSGFNSSISFAFHYYDYEYTNPGSTERATEQGLFLFPGVNMGYLF